MGRILTQLHAHRILEAHGARGEQALLLLQVAAQRREAAFGLSLHAARARQFIGRFARAPRLPFSFRFELCQRGARDVRGLAGGRLGLIQRGQLTALGGFASGEIGDAGFRGCDFGLRLFALLVRGARARLDLAQFTRARQRGGRLAAPRDHCARRVEYLARQCHRARVGWQGTRHPARRAA